MIAAATLNKVAVLLGTTDKNVVLNACVATLVREGLDIAEAIDAVFGDGSYEKLASSVYHSLRGETPADEAPTKVTADYAPGFGWQYLITRKATGDVLQRSGNFETEGAALRFGKSVAAELRCGGGL